MERFAIKIDKNLKTHLYKICRLCGIDNPEKVKVLDDETIVNLEDGEPELWKKVLDCIGLLITKDDKMPQFMCTLCVDKINDFFEFREMCYATDGQTRKLLGIKDEPKLKISTRSSSVDCKTEDQDIKQPVATIQRSGRKRRNADMDICNASTEIKIDQTDDFKPATTIAGTSASKKKRLKLDNPEAEAKQEFDVKPGTSLKSGLSARLGKTASASKLADSPKLGLSKKRLKIEPTAKEKKELRPAKISKLTKKKLKGESPPPVVIPEERASLQMQKKKKTLELLKQRKLAKKVAVVKVEKLRKCSVDAKIKEEAPVPAPAPPPPLPKVKLKDKCTICSESFVNKTLLDKHIKVTHIPSVVRYHCVQCNETLKKNMEIKNHNLWHKLSKTPFQCGNCAESACSIYTYSKHIRDCGQVTYLDAHIPDWHCPECSGVYETTYLFNIHSCVSNKLVCPGCDRSLKWKEDYFKHIPACPSAIHRIPEYMSSNIQVKNEAEHPSSPIPPLHTVAPSIPLQATPSSRITPPLMDSNQCVVIPGNVALLEEAASSPSKSSGKKSKRITKKDLKRFDKLLKSTMTTLVSIKQEPPLGDAAVADNTDEDEDRSKSLDVEAASEMTPGSPLESAPCSPLPSGDDFHHNDDDDDSADDQTSSSQPVGTIKQEIIDEGYRDLYNNIEVNIKREVVLKENRNIEVSTTPKKNSGDIAEEPIAPKPVLKLKITKEHGTLNSVLLDSPKSEKKKKKKKRKEEKLKAAESREEADVAPVVPVEALEAVSASKVPDIPDVPDNVDQAESVEEEPPMPLPEIVCIKQEIAEPEEGENSLSIQSSHTVPSIVAATSGSLQIASVSEGVHFNGAEENANDEDGNETEETLQEGEAPTASDPQQEELDIKPSLEDLIPMLRIASVSSGEDFINKSVKPAAKRKRRAAAATKASTSTPQIVSVSSGSAAIAYQPELEKLSEDVEEGEESCEKVDNNENIFDFTQVRIKEEIVDPTYEEQDYEMHQVDEEEVENEDEGDDDNEEEEEVENDDEDLENDDGEVECAITQKQVEENAYIANIDFNNLNIKQEKEYIDDGLDNAAALEEGDSSDTESESSSSTEDYDSESEREYRDMPLEDNDNESNAVAAPLGLQIAAVHSEFACSQPNEKTESNRGVQEGSDDKTLSNATTETSELGGIQVTCNIALNEGLEAVAFGDKQKKEISENLTSSKEHTQIQMDVDDGSESKLEELIEILDQPSTSAAGADAARNIEHEEISFVGSGVDMSIDHAETKPGEASQSSTLSKEFVNFSSSDAEGKSFVLEASISTDTDTALSSANSTISTEPKPLTFPSQTSTSTVADSTPEASHGPLDHGRSLRDTHACSHNLDQSPIATITNELIDPPSSSQGTSHIFDATNQVSSVPTLDLFKCDRDTSSDELSRLTGSLTYKSAFNLDQLPISTAIQDFSDPSSSSQATSHISDAISQVDVPSASALDAVRLSATTRVANNTDARQSVMDPCPTLTNIALDDINEFIDQSSILNLTTLSTTGPDRIISTTIDSFIDDDITMSEVDPIANEIDRLTDDSPSLLLREIDEYTKSETGTSAPEVVAHLETKVSNSSADSSDRPTLLLRSPVQSVINSNLYSALASADDRAAQDNCQLINTGEDSQISFTEVEQQHMHAQSPAYQCTGEQSERQGSSIATHLGSHHAETHNKISLTHVLSSSIIQAPVSVTPTDNTHEFRGTASYSSYPTNVQRFTSVDTNIHLTELCSSTSSLGAEFQVDLATPTAGQLHSLITPATTVLHPQHSSGFLLTNDTDLNLRAPVLSEEVQNLLNEDTVAANHFQLNESILRARCSTYPQSPAVAVSVPHFTDFENVNEIAENNNNANIERELQDELGNVLAAAIADRSPNDEVEDNNVMNENRANFDLT